MNILTEVLVACFILCCIALGLYFTVQGGQQV